MEFIDDIRIILRPPIIVLKRNGIVVLAKTIIPLLTPFERIYISIFSNLSSDSENSKKYPPIAVEKQISKTSIKKGMFINTLDE